MIAVLAGKPVRLTCAVLAAGAGVVVGVAAAGAFTGPVSGARATEMRGAVAAHRRCFGAAARDPEHQPCDNPRLRLTVVPRPRDAPLVPSGPCRLIRREAPEVCAFGVPSSRATATIALVGDSHSAHWRAALDVVAHAKRWRGLSLYTSACPFTRATRDRPPPGPSECGRWTHQVVRWLAKRPRIGTVFVSGSSHLPVIPRPGQDGFATKVAGYRAAWSALPASVRHIIVIRDTPVDSVQTPACVERAIARRTPAGRACARPRSIALHDDPATVAATQLASPRVAVIDLSDFMCDASLCYPVVGGVLVHRDVDHLTRLFSTTLGPFLLRAVDRLMTSWRADRR